MLTYNHMAIRSASARLDAAFQALADPTRRGMIALLAEADRTAGELGDPFRISQPAASKHIRVLERSGMIRRSVEGRHHKFHLESSPLRDAEQWITRHRRFWEGSLKQLDSLLADMQKGRDTA